MRPLFLVFRVEFVVFEGGCCDKVNVDGSTKKEGPELARMAPQVPSGDKARCLPFHHTRRLKHP